MLSISRAAIALALTATVAPLSAQITTTPANTPASGTPTTSQPYQMSQSEQEAINAQALLTSALKRIAANGEDGSALVDAGNAAITLDDANAAMGFFNRANGVWPNNPRVLAGMGSAMVRLENPTEALRLFALSISRGGNERSILADRALAYDLTGDNARAQKDYQLALQGGYSDRTLRLYALSLGISGDTDKAVQTIAPLLQKRDRAAWRDRAFILAMNGRTKEALDIVKQTMPANVATGITPYLMKMNRLSNKQMAAAVHYGQFPTSDTQLAAVGRSDTAASMAATSAKASGAGQKGSTPRFVDEKGRAVKLSKTEQRRLIQEQENKKKAEAVAAATAEQERLRLAAVQRQQEQAQQAEQVRLAEVKRQEDVRLAAERKRVEDARLAEVKRAEDTRLAEAKRADEARQAEQIRLASAQVNNPVSANIAPAHSAPINSAPVQVVSSTPMGVIPPVQVAPTTPMGVIPPVTVAATSVSVSPATVPAAVATTGTTPGISPTEIAASSVQSTASVPTTMVTAAATPAPGFSPASEASSTPNGSFVGPVNNVAAPGIVPANLPPSTAATNVADTGVDGTNMMAANAVDTVPTTIAAAPATDSNSFHAFSLSDLVQAVKPPETGPERAEAPVDLATLEKLRADKIAADRAAAVAAKAEADKKKAAEAKLAKEKELADAKAKAAEEKKKAATPKVWAQIATGSGTNKFTSDLRKAKSRDTALFKGKEGSRIETGKMSRLVVGPFVSVKEANAWLAKYKKAGGDGFVWTSKGDEDIKPVAK